MKNIQSEVLKLMRDEHQDNQATKLEQLFLEVSNPELSEENLAENEHDELIEVDVLQLAPRSEVHKYNQSNVHLSFHATIWRIVLVIIFIILICCGMFILYMYYLAHIDCICHNIIYRPNIS